MSSHTRSAAMARTASSTAQSVATKPNGNRNTGAPVNHPQTAAVFSEGGFSENRRSPNGNRNGAAPNHPQTEPKTFTARRTTASSAASGSEWYGADRPKWIGPFSEDSTPAYITGEYPGDYGWDTAGISSDPEQYEAYREIEVIHSRWAMTGSIGSI